AGACQSHRDGKCLWRRLRLHHLPLHHPRGLRFAGGGGRAGRGLPRPGLGAGGAVAPGLPGQGRDRGPDRRDPEILAQPRRRSAALIRGAVMSLKWTDVLDIAIELAESKPEVDPRYVNFVDLHRWVLALPDFADDPQRGGEKLLEAIQAAWIEELD